MSRAQSMVVSKKAADAVATAEKQMAAAKAKLAAATTGGVGPFMRRFSQFLKRMKIDIKKYFCGTYIGLDLN